MWLSVRRIACPSPSIRNRQADSPGTQRFSEKPGNAVRLFRCKRCKLCNEPDGSQTPVSTGEMHALHRLRKSCKKPSKGPFTAVIRVRIPLGTPTTSQSHTDQATTSVLPLGEKALARRILQNDLAIERCAELWYTALSLEVDVDDAETLVVAVRPLKVIQKAPEKVAPKRDAFGGGSL
jgi:hypothetical protein